MTLKEKILQALSCGEFPPLTEKQLCEIIESNDFDGAGGAYGADDTDGYADGADGESNRTDGAYGKSNHADGYIDDMGGAYGAGSTAETYNTDGAYGESNRKDANGDYSESNHADGADNLDELDANKFGRGGRYGRGRRKTANDGIYAQVKAAIGELEAEGEVFYDGRKRLHSSAAEGLVKGTIRANERGFAFLIPEDKSLGFDLFLPKHSLHGALDGDRVLAKRIRGTEDEAEVVKILARGRTDVAGTFFKDGGAYCVVPDMANFVKRIFVPASLTMGARSGDKVLCRITAYPKDKAPNGKVIEILGKSGDFYAEELAIIRNYGLYEEFPAEVENEAVRVSEERLTPDGRRDLRGLTTITIDGDDTRDIDDAVSLEREGENYVLGVHIADVGNYVKRGSAIDKEAYSRGTSVYFPDRVLPMLPRALSNGACSLNEGEDRYALSCIMKFTPDGERISAEIAESIIRSNHRTTYKEITALVEGDAAMNEKYADIAPMCRLMKELCEALISRRERLGNIDLSVKEAHISLNERGEIVIPDYERTISEKMIEQFMISANEAVAERMEREGVPFMYRIHEQPAPEKVAAFKAFLADIGIAGRISEDEPQPEQFQKILYKVAGKPCESAVNKAMLRTMQKARYCERNAGHFGIASECYCHFTSPIRRYPDLFIHRIIKGVLHGEKQLMKKLYGDVAAEEAAHCSLCERNADGAERDVDDLYKTVYMSDRVGETYPATISGVTNFGIFAELDNTVEGLIRIEKLPGGYYEFYEDKFMLKGERTFRLGDKITVRVDGADWGNMRTEFSLADMPEEKNGKHEREPRKNGNARENTIRGERGNSARGGRESERRSDGKRRTEKSGHGGRNHSTRSNASKKSGRKAGGAGARAAEKRASAKFYAQKSRKKRKK